MTTSAMIAGLAKDGELVAVEHRLALTTEEKWRRVDAFHSAWVVRYRWSCSCGAWRSTWRDHPRLTWRTARAHVVSGQLSAEL